MLVTAYYDIYNKPLSFMTYVYLFYDLAMSGIPITVFTDPSLVDKFKIFPPNVKVIGTPIETFELYNIFKNYNRDLPANRNPERDTKEFIGLMNTKPEFIKKAAELSDDDTFIWIDFGILKLVKNVERFINQLKLINQTTFSKITIPGCQGFGSPFTPDVLTKRFFGELVIMPRQHIDTFFSHCKNVINDFNNTHHYKLTWETNIWYIIEYCAAKDIINWYYSTQDDFLVINLFRILNTQ